MAAGSDPSVRVALASVPLLCKEFLHLPDWSDHVDTFLKAGSYSALVVLGIEITEDMVVRDLLVGGGEAGVVEQVRYAHFNCFQNFKFLAITA